MGNGKKYGDLKVIEVEFHVSMYCKACERTVAKIVSKFKGVEMFTTDMNKHKVVVKGCIDPQKLLKKLRKKTGKKVEIVAKEKEEDNENSKDKCYNNSITHEGNLNARREEEEGGGGGVSLTQPPFLFMDCCKEDLFMAFSDENPNACSTM